MGRFQHKPASDPIDRRSFFRQILSGSIDQIEQAARKMLPDLPAEAPDGGADNDRYLRPPGAAPADRFTDLCAGCRACLCVCPAKCIQMEVGPSGENESETAARHPFIVAREAACVICDDLACTHACPTGALRPLPDPSEIRMGTAAMNHQRCLRGLPDASGTPAPARGEPCRVCVDHCPVGETALSIDDQGLVQVGASCVGCGMCEWACPTEPASIQVESSGPGAEERRIRASGSIIEDAPRMGPPDGPMYGNA